MVTKWGLSDKLGPLAYGEDEGEVFLGRSVTQHKNLSDETAHAIEEEIRHFIDRNYDRAKRLLEENIEKLHTMAKALVKYETIDTAQIDAIMEGREPGPPEDWTDDDDQDQGTSNGVTDKVDQDQTGTIGGPAGQH